MIITGKKFSKPEMSRVINGDKTLRTEEEKPELVRLDHILMGEYPNRARATLQKLVKEGRVRVNGEIVRKNNLKFPIDVEIKVDFPPTSKELPEIPVIYEDEHVKVVEKPVGMLSMSKGEYCPEATLEDYGLLVHRLDRDTSGVVILAKDEKTQGMLRRQFQERKTHKTYVAVVVGRPKVDEAMLDLPIARNLKHPTTFLVEAGGKSAQTYYKVLDSNGIVSLVELRPTTGRTHQLRVHMKYIGTPIVGDLVYGDDSGVPFRPSRLFLHARSLEITIPVDDGDNKRMTFESPVPKEFYDVLR